MGCYAASAGRPAAAGRRLCGDVAGNRAARWLVSALCRLWLAVAGTGLVRGVGAAPPARRRRSHLCGDWWNGFLQSGCRDRRLQGKGCTDRSRKARVEWVSTELDRAVRTVVRECMSVSPGEEV